MRLSWNRLLNSRTDACPSINIDDFVADCTGIIPLMDTQSERRDDEMELELELSVYIRPPSLPP